MDDGQENRGADCEMSIDSDGGTKCMRNGAAPFLLIKCRQAEAESFIILNASGPPILISTIPLFTQVNGIGHLSINYTHR